MGYCDAVCVLRKCSLHVPLEAILVRKLGVPGYAELAMGAIAEGGVHVFNTKLIDELRLSGEQIEQVAVAECQEIARRSRRYRGDRPFPEVRRKTIIHHR